MADQVRITPGHAQATVVRPPAEMDYTNADQVRQELASALAAGTAGVIIDLTSTTFCDTAGLREIVTAYKAAATTGRDLRVVVPVPLERLFTVTALDRVLAVYPTLSAALAAAGQATEG
jgi:anti-sigma B factor antagonist